MLNNQTNVATEVLTLAHIDQYGYQFNIPCYQRPYVWPDEAVLKLFDDINKARLAKDDNYFIGTVLTSIEQKDNGEKIYVLIDGQQRTTTLMLIALAYRKVKLEKQHEAIPITNLAALNGRPRLQFEIRDQVQQLMGSLAGLADHQFPSNEAIANNPYLTRLYAALKVLIQQIDALDDNSRIELGGFIYNNVQWVNNIVPCQMDLNRLFSTMNTAGIQLEQTDILKSKLFKQLKTEKPLFDAIWVACEHMENYFERNVRKVFPHAPWNDIQLEHLTVFDENFFKKDGEEQPYGNGLTISQLATHLCSENAPDDLPTLEFETYELDQETVYCRSIVSFPLLLIHTYRIFLARFSKFDIIPRVHADKLLEIFNPLMSANETDVKNFIKLLWQVRYQFDRWVVKWGERDDSNDEQLRLTYITRNQSSGNWYINRSPKELSAIVMLQSVRNFTGERSAQYWITAFIAGLIENNITEEKDALTLLEKIDNELSLTASGETQKTASFKQAQSRNPDTISWHTLRTYFDESKGTSFEHYWFQKLEYVLWKIEKYRDDKKFKGYRITAKNSVEHVYPQNEEYNNQLPHKYLNAFGNLVLLSPGENSSYNNQTVKKKKADFESKPYFDSLKLKAIFELMANEEWDASKIQQHQSEMLNKLTIHYVENND
jgi:uncharacterized protein with ParB-like and HNH nuclease domain